MNTVLNNYETASCIDINKHEAFYRSDVFYCECIKLKIPETVQYVRNIFNCFLEAQASRLLYENSKMCIQNYRNEKNHFVNSVMESVAGLNFDMRWFAQRNIREWFSYIAKISDSIVQVLNIVFSLEFRQWDNISSREIIKKVTCCGYNSIADLCSAFYKEIEIIIKINNFSKHNQNIFTLEKDMGSATKPIRYAIPYAGDEYNVDELISEETERKILKDVLQILDNIFSCANSIKHTNRYYVASEYRYQERKVTDIVNHVSLASEDYCSVEIEHQYIGNGHFEVTSSIMMVDNEPENVVYMMTICDYDGGCISLTALAVFDSNNIEVYSNGECIGTYVCRTHEDRTEKYLHFKKFEFMPN